MLNLTCTVILFRTLRISILRQPHWIMAWLKIYIHWNRLTWSEWSGCQACIQAITLLKGKRLFICRTEISIYNNMTMKSGKQRITGFMKCIIFHGNATLANCFVLKNTQNHAHVQVCLKWNENQKRWRKKNTAHSTSTGERRKREKKNTERTYALIWFDGWCVEIHGFCYCILFPSSFLQRSTFGFSTESLVLHRL